MSKIEELRKVKDQATKAMEKRQYAKAAALYLEIAEREPDPDWHQRAGDAFRRAGDAERAVSSLSLAASGYATGGFLLKAIAVGKTILQVDPQHTRTQAMLAELYARRDGSAPRGPAPAPVATVLAPPVRAQVAAPVVLAPPPATPSVAARTPRLQDSIPLVAVDDILDEHGHDTIAAPIEILPLRRVLGGRRSEQIAVADVMAIAAAEEAQVVSSQESPGVYEITLDDEDLTIEAPEPIPVQPRPPVALADELDFGGVMAEPSPPRTLSPIPSPILSPSPMPSPMPSPRPSPMPSPMPSPSPAAHDELDFGGVMDDSPPPPPPPAPSSPLPRIPLFSSLPEAELRYLIDRVTLRELSSGEEVIRQGERGGSLFVVVEGKVRVVAAQDGQAQRELALLGAGAFFGEMGLLTDEPRSATVVAERDTQLLELPRELAWEIVRRSPEVLRTLLRFFRDRVLDRLIERTPLFSGLSPDDARTLAAQFVFLELEAGVTPVQRGQRAPGMFFLLCGAAEAVRDGVTVGQLGPGDIFGEMSLLLRAPASADVRVTRKSWALELPASRFQEIMVTYPQVLAYVSELFDARQAQLTATTGLPGDSKVDLL